MSETLTHPTPTPTEIDAALKAKHRAMWALGSYAAVAADVVHPLGAALVEASAVASGTTVLDVGAGTGNAAIAAALTGARVTASDLTPELLEIGRGLAADAGVEVVFTEADAEALPFDSNSFDTVLSCIGVMFAPHHQAAADELVRVSRPGGTIGLLNWTPEGFIGNLFATMKPFAPPPPAGAQPAPLWGSESHVRELFGSAVDIDTVEKGVLSVDLFATPEEFRDYFRRNYGPTIAVYRFLGDDSERVTALDAALVDLARRFDLGDGTGALRLEWEYLIVIAHTR